MDRDLWGNPFLGLCKPRLAVGILVGAVMKAVIGLLAVPEILDSCAGSPSASSSYSAYRCVASPKALDGILRDCRMALLSAGDNTWRQQHAIVTIVQTPCKQTPL